MKVVRADFRDSTATIKDVKKHRLWVALEAGSGIVPQHDCTPHPHLRSCLPALLLVPLPCVGA